MKRMLRAVSEGGRRKAFTGQVRGLVHWERSEIIGCLSADLTSVHVQIHVYTHLQFSYHPSMSEWCLKLRSITSPWETLLLKLSSQSTCLPFAHSCLIRATWVPTSLNGTKIGEWIILCGKLLHSRLCSCTFILSHKSNPSSPDFTKVSLCYSHKRCEVKFWEKKRAFNWRLSLWWGLASVLVEVI